MRKNLVSIFKVPRMINAVAIKKFVGYNFILIFGAKGFLKYKFNISTTVDVRNNKIKVSGPDPAMYYTYIKILKSLIDSTTVGYNFFLELRGVGFKYKIGTGVVYLVLGFSHLKKVFIPKNITVYLINSKLLQIVGHNKQLLNDFGFIIKKTKPENVYKGKGIFFKGETPLLKEGKKSAAF